MRILRLQLIKALKYRKNIKRRKKKKKRTRRKGLHHQKRALRILLISLSTTWRFLILLKVLYTEPGLLIVDRILTLLIIAPDSYVHATQNLINTSKTIETYTRLKPLI